MSSTITLNKQEVGGSGKVHTLCVEYNSNANIDRLMYAQTLKCLPYRQLEGDMVQIPKSFRERTNSEPFKTDDKCTKTGFGVKRNLAPHAKWFQKSL